MKIDATTLLLVGGGLLAAYMLTRPTTPTTPTYPVGYNPYGGTTGMTALQQQQLLAQQSGNSTAAVISASGSALQGLSSLIGNFF